MPRPLNPALCMLFAVIFVLAGWEISALLLSTPALPTPQDTIPILMRFAPELAPGFAVSLYRVAASLVIGVGLGLPIARRIAELHGGAVVLTSRPGVGTDVTLSLSYSVRADDPSLHSPTLNYDYTGGHRHALVELSETIPGSLYDSVELP